MSPDAESPAELQDKESLKEKCIRILSAQAVALENAKHELIELYKHNGGYDDDDILRTAEVNLNIVTGLVKTCLKTLEAT